MNRLQELLRDFSDVTVVERRFDTGDGIDGLGDNPFVSLLITPFLLTSNHPLHF